MDGARSSHAEPGVVALRKCLHAGQIARGHVHVPGAAAAEYSLEHVLSMTCIRCIRRARWAHAEPSPAALRECLDVVADRAWVARDCLTRLAPDAAAQAELIEYGLAETERQCRDTAEPGGRGFGADAGREVRNSNAWLGNAEVRSGSGLSGLLRACVVPERRTFHVSRQRTRLGSAEVQGAWQRAGCAGAACKVCMAFVP